MEASERIVQKVQLRQARQRREANGSARLAADTRGLEES